MKPSRHAQMFLFAGLCAFTALNLTPILWAFLTSIKLPVDAFATRPSWSSLQPSTSITRFGWKRSSGAS